MAVPLNIIFDDFSMWLLGYRVEFSCLYIPLGHCFISSLWLWSTDEYVNFDFERKSIFNVAEHKDDLDMFRMSIEKAIEQLDGKCILHGNIDQTLLNSLHSLLNFEIGRLDCRVITTEYKTHVHCIHMYHLLLQSTEPYNLIRSFRSLFIYNI